jgi:hypothetical protein
MCLVAVHTGHSESVGFSEKHRVKDTKWTLNTNDCIFTIHPTIY